MKNTKFSNYIKINLKLFAILWLLSFKSNAYSLTISNTSELVHFFKKPNDSSCNTERIDSLKKNNVSLIIEAGMPTTIFLNNYAQNNNFTPGLFQPFTEYIPPYTFGVKILNGSKYFIGLNYNYFGKFNSYADRIQGDVVSRFYHVIMAEIGKSISYKKFSFSPIFNINYKSSGIEEVFVCYIPGSFNEGEPVVQTFQYNSLGFGLGGSIKYYLLPNFYISTDLRFTHYFEKNKPLGKPLGGFEEFYKNYRVNRDAITLSLNIGYQIKLGK